MSDTNNTPTPAVNVNAPEENKDAKLVRETFFNTVKSELALNGASTWGVKESMTVIRDLVELNENETLGFDMIEPFIREVVNPNQFANKLADKGKIVRSGAKGRSRSVDISGL